MRVGVRAVAAVLDADQPTAGRFAPFTWQRNVAAPDPFALLTAHVVQRVAKAEGLVAGVPLAWWNWIGWSGVSTGARAPALPTALGLPAGVHGTVLEPHLKSNTSFTAAILTGETKAGALTHLTYHDAPWPCRSTASARSIPNAPVPSLVRLLAPCMGRVTASPAAALVPDDTLSFRYVLGRGDWYGASGEERWYVPGYLSAWWVLWIAATVLPLWPDPRVPAVLPPPARSAAEDRVEGRGFFPSKVLWPSHFPDEMAQVYAEPATRFRYYRDLDPCPERRQLFGVLLAAEELCEHVQFYHGERELARGVEASHTRDLAALVEQAAVLYFRTTQAIVTERAIERGGGGDLP